MVVFKEDHRLKFKHLYNNPNYSDFSIVLVNLKRKIFVWKGILSVHSEFFDRLFNTNYIEDDTQENVVEEAAIKERDNKQVIEDVADDQQKKKNNSKLLMDSTSTAATTIREPITTTSSSNVHQDDDEGDEDDTNMTSFLNQNDEWVVNDLIEEEVLLQLIEFFYTGEICFTTEQSINLLLISQKYMVKGGLIESIQIDIETNIKPSNCFSVFKLIIPLNVQDSFIERILQTCVLEMSKNLEAILSTNQEELLNFAPTTLATFLRAATRIKYGLRCDGKKLLRFIIDWLMRDVENRKDYMAEIKAIESQITYQYKY